MKKTITIAIVLMSILFVLDSCTGNQVSNNDTKKLQSTVPETQINYLQTGKDLAIQTKSSLAKYLVAALSEKGTAGAVEFCNTKAIPITDSMSIVLNTKIKRVSDKPRNLHNSANEAELAFIKKWKEAKAKGEEQPAIVTEIDGKMVGYYPIVTNQMCIQCHGKPYTDIKSDALNKIKKLYPTDQAIGYAENEIRGIFVVEMNKK